MTDNQVILACEQQLDKAKFDALAQMMVKIQREKNTAIMRHNHYAIGMDSMAKHMDECEHAGAAFEFIKGDPHGHFECVQCGVKA